MFTKKFLPVAVILFTLVTLLVQNVFAQDSSATGQTVTLPKNETINHDYFAAGRTVIISGIVNGDVYAAGAEVIVDGTVNGDLLVAGGRIDIDGTVSQNARIAGGNINVSGTIGKNLSIAGGNLYINRAAKINGNLVGAGGDISVSAPVAGDITLGSGAVTLSSVAGGSADIAVGKLLMTPEAKIAGSLNYWSDNQVDIQPGATVSGKITQHLLPQTPQVKSNQQIAQEVSRGLYGLFVFLRIVGFVSSLVVGMILFNVFPVFADNTVKRFNNEIWKSMGIGFLITIAVPTAALVLFFTVIGIPLVFFLLMIFALVIYISHLVTSLAIGRLLTDKIGNRLSIGWCFVIGLVVYFIISSIPLIGRLFLFFLNLVSLGALFSEKIYLLKELKSKKIV